MNLYNIKEKYICYLQETDKKVCDNKNGTRPYAGIVLNVEDMKYYIPLSSPKLKHLRMKNTHDFMKIDNGRLGALNFNNMIPVTDDCVKRIQLESITDYGYLSLLQRQFRYINSDHKKIQKTAVELRKLYSRGCSQSSKSQLSKYEREIIERCCNFPLLEEKCKEYAKMTAEDQSTMH